MHKISPRLAAMLERLTSRPCPPTPEDRMSPAERADLPVYHPPARDARCA